MTSDRAGAPIAAGPIDDDAPDGLECVDMLLNMGPQHPSTHGVFRMILTVEGERIVDAEPVIGYLHRGSEKLCERENYRQIITLFDRLDYVANFNNELVFCLAAEKLMGIAAPERAQLIRIILCELNRISSHMLFYGAFGTDIGIFGTAFMYGFREREELQQIFESVSGARMMHSYIRVGGVAEDLPDGFPQRVRGALDSIRRAVDEADRLLTYSEIMLERTRNVGAIAGPDAVDWGSAGLPCGPAASSTTSASTSPMSSTTASASTFPWVRTATAGTATGSTWRRCASPPRSSSRPSTCSKTVRYRPRSPSSASSSPP